MDMEARTCREVIAEIAHALREQTLVGLNQSTYQHLSVCSRCRAGLLLLVRSLDAGLDGSASDAACEQRQADLAAFIDLEATDAALAGRMYPQIWWHLWTCGSCSQTYEFTQTLLLAQQTGQIQPLKLPRPAPRQRLHILQRVSLSRQILALALPIRRTPAMIPRGGDDREYIIYDESEDGQEQRQFTIVAELQSDGAWQLRVTVIPPPDGLLALTSGELRRIALFDPDGTAILTDIDASMLTASDGPGLKFSIVSEDEAA